MKEETMVSAWDGRMEAAAKFLNLSAVYFEQLLADKAGITKEMGVAVLDSDDFRFGDFREAFKDKPVPVVRLIYTALKGGKKDKEPADSGSPADERIGLLKSLGLKVRLEEADPTLLLPLYLADKPGDPVTQALKKRFGDKAVIAFKDDGSVAVQETLEYIASLEQQFPEQSAITVDGKLTKLYQVGTKPNQMVEEDPLFPGEPLRNGHSVVNHRRWTEINLECRQFCRLVLRRGDIDTANKDGVLRLMERAKAMESLVEAYPEADLEFREMKARDELPKLKIQLGSLASTKPQNPFGVPRRY